MIENRGLNRPLFQRFLNYILQDLTPLFLYAIGPWQLGMPKAQVTSFADFGPYLPVESTGGVETYNAMVDGKKTNVSFVFDKDALQYIQVWKYEGGDAAVAQKAVLDLFDMFQKSYGGATIDGVDVNNGAPLTHDAVVAVLTKILGTAHELGDKFHREHNATMTFVFDMHPNRQPAGSQLDGEFAYASRYDTFYVFLYQDLPNAPVRHQKATVQTGDWK